MRSRWPAGAARAWLGSRAAPRRPRSGLPQQLRARPAERLQRGTRHFETFGDRLTFGDQFRVEWGGDDIAPSSASSSVNTSFPSLTVYFFAIGSPRPHHITSFTHSGATGLPTRPFGFSPLTS